MEKGLTEIFCILPASRVGLHPYPLVCRDFAVVFPEPALGISDQELVKNVEVVLAIGGHGMRQQLFNDLAPDSEVVQ